MIQKVDDLRARGFRHLWTNRSDLNMEYSRNALTVEVVKDIDAAICNHTHS
jgi:gamma-glutamyl phosphate reductase